MQRRRFVTAAGAGLTLALAGCLSSAEEQHDGGTVDEDDADATVEVSGTGTVETDPDMGSFMAAVEASGEEADEVRSQLATDAEAVKEALLDAGLDDDDITTSRYTIREERNGFGYEGTHAYHVEVHDVDAVGEMIDIAVDAGADDIGRVNFTLADETRDAFRGEALERAIEDARSDAEAIAAAKGLEVVGVVHVTTEDSGVRPFHADADEMLAMEVSDDAGTDIDQGPVTVSARVTIVYALS